MDDLIIEYANDVAPKLDKTNSLGLTLDRTLATQTGSGGKVSHHIFIVSACIGKSKIPGCFQNIC